MAGALARASPPRPAGLPPAAAGVPPWGRRAAPARRPPGRRAGRSLLLVLVGAAAAAAPAPPCGGAPLRADASGGGTQRPPRLLPFPTPAAADGAAADGGGASPPLRGRLDTLPALACNVRDPVAADGRRGVSFLAAAASAPRFVRRGNRTCDAPVELPEMPRQLDGLDDAATGGRTCATRNARFATQQLNDVGELQPDAGVWRRQRTDALGRDVTRGALAHEADVARLLTLQRNTLSGSVARQTGVYDVVAVTRSTAGYCAGPVCSGTGVMAVDVLGGVEYSQNATHVQYSLVTFVHANGTDGQVVSVRDRGLLSLGRAVMADGRWLARLPEWRSYFNVGMVLFAAASDRPSDAVPPGLESRVWDLRGDGRGRRGGSTAWLQTIAYTFCQPPARSFVRDPERLCAGLTEPPPPARSGRRGNTPSVNGQPVPTATHPSSMVGRSAMWYFLGWPRAHAPRAADVRTWDDVLLERPCWLAGLGSRELNAGSPDEVGLARRLGRSALVVRMEPPFNSSQAHRPPFYEGRKIVVGDPS